MSLLSFFYGCRKTQERVLAKLDGDAELDENDERHLKACPPCRDYHEDHSRIQAAMPVGRAPEPSADFAQKTLTAFRSKVERNAPAPEWTQAPRRVEPWLLATSMAAGVLLLVGLSQFFGHRLPQPFSGAVAKGSVSRPIGRAAMFPDSRAALIGVSFPSRSERIWNFR